MVSILLNLLRFFAIFRGRKAFGIHIFGLAKCIFPLSSLQKLAFMGPERRICIPSRSLIDELLTGNIKEPFLFLSPIGC